MTVESTFGDAAKKAGRILVVEDDPIVSLFVDQYLRSTGADIQLLDNGDDALQVIEADPSSIAMLLTDVVLPKRSGWELARKARQLSPDLPVVYMTRLCGGDWQQQGVAGSALLNKPFDRARALAIIQPLLKSQ